MSARPRSADEIRKVTSELSEEFLREQYESRPDFVYSAHPHTSGIHPTWRLRFDSTNNLPATNGVDLNGEVVLGREQDVPGFAELCNLVGADQLGVSRQHATLRPTESKLYLIDMNSTNGTTINGHSIGVNMPYSLSNGDVVRLGRMEFTVSILKNPGRMDVAAPSNVDDPFEVLPEIARSIAAQLTVKEVLKQTLVSAMKHTPADEVSVWLVDEHSGELFLEAEEGMDGEQVRRLPVADSLAGQVINTGKPMTVNRQNDRDQIKIKTGYLVEAVIYVPLKLGGTTFGVLSAAHREKGKLFSKHDERVMIAIANMTALAIQNARVHQAATRALADQTKLLNAMNYTFSNTFKGLANTAIGYTGILQTDPTLTQDTLEMCGMIRETGDAMITLIHHMNEVFSLTQDFHLQRSEVDLTDVVAQVIQDTQGMANEKGIQIDFQAMGKPSYIRGDVNYLYRTVLNIVDNAIRYSPNETMVMITLIFSFQEIILRVRDQGPGIAEDDLRYLFERYIRGEQSQGVGLGLYLARIAVEAHQGVLSAANASDQGAEFTITLPGSLRVA